PYAIALDGQGAYISNQGAGSIFYCPISNGLFSGSCQDSQYNHGQIGDPQPQPSWIALGPDNAGLYVGDSVYNDVYYCPISADVPGTFNYACQLVANSSGALNGNTATGGIALGNNQQLYIGLQLDNGG